MRSLPLWALFSVCCSNAFLKTALGQEDQTCTAEGECSADNASGTVSSDPNCKDTHESCAFWAREGECEKNPGYMLHSCKLSCNSCKGVVEHKNDWGEPQDASGPKRKEIEAFIRDIEDYMRGEVFVDTKYAKVKNDCQNRHKMCSAWALEGECEANPKYMTMQCAPSCKSCEKIDFDSRCPFNKTIPDALAPGDLDKMFENIVTLEHYKQYQPTILSRPSVPAGVDLADVDYAIGPWVVTFENVLTDEECDKMIQLGADRGYEQSYDVGEKLFDGTYDKHKNSGRTSTNAWCVEECYEDPTTKNVIAKIENITGISDEHSEYLQLLRYEVGQHYMEHHDYIDYQLKRSEGVRILTLFLYLNDVEAGGGTDFPQLGITVMPKKGKAVLWPSVLNERPNYKDGRTQHQALPVEAGIKYGANAWIHMNDFKDAFEKSCI